MCVWKNELTQLGHRVTFFTTDFEHQRKQWVTTIPEGFVLLSSKIAYKQNISILRLLNHFIVSISFILELRKQKTKPDLILVSYPTILLSLVAVIFGKKIGAKVIVDVRDQWPDIFLVHPILKIFMFPLFWIKNYIMKNADEVTAVSPGYYHWALPGKEVPDQNILPLTYQTKTPISHRNIQPDGPINLIFVGTLGKTYDLDSILSIHDELLKSDISFQISVCGDGPERDRFEKEIKSRPKIKLLGWLNKDELQQSLDQAHVGLMLYHSESPQGWPNKLFEYMSNGLPIINTLPGESWDLIQNANLGINLAKSQLNELVWWISELQAKPEAYKTYLNNNLNTYNQRFSAEKNLESLKQLIN